MGNLEKQDTKQKIRYWSACLAACTLFIFLSVRFSSAYFSYAIWNDIKEIYIKKQYSISFFRESFLAIRGILFFYGILIFTSLLQKNIDGAMVGLDYFLFSMPFL